jgi:ketosteroid isomerase-like protein
MSKDSTIRLALTYHRAWTSGDFDVALACLAPDISFDTPAGPLHGASALRQYMEPFAQGLVSSRVLAVHGSDDEAIMLYDTATATVPSAPAAEWYRIEGDLITAGRIVFDRLPFALARGSVVPAAG